MKTLDEVIKANECCILDDRCEDCPYMGIACCAERETDALHYLKEFKRISARLEKIALGNITEALEKLDNPALTWDELKQMEGKPVWIEDVIHEKGEWLLIHMVEKNDIWYVDKWADKEDFNRDGFGRLWEAYRKERE